MKTRFVYAFVFIMLLALLTACNSDGVSSISVEEAWGRPSPMYPTSGGIYMIIKNAGDTTDTLLSGSSPACESIEIHDTVMKSDGTMGMNLIDKPLEIPAGGEVELKVGGLHAMCIMKKEAFAPGNIIELTLVFDKAGEQTISVEIRGE